MALKSLARVFAPLALGLVFGCDAPNDDDFAQSAEDGTGDGDDDAGDDDDADDGPTLDPVGDSGTSDPSDSDGPSDPDGPTVPPPGDDSPFNNDFPVALDGLAGMAYGCTAEPDLYYELTFQAGGVVEVVDQDDAVTPGSYTTTASGLSVSFPSLGFEESTIQHVVELDVLAGFTTATLRCSAFSIDISATGQTDIVSCPNIHYIQGVGWESNEFHFGPGGYVRHRQWLELTQIPDTLYSATSGIYVTLGQQVYMVFAGKIGTEDEDEAFLTGTITEQGLFIDQLEPESGACQ
ncbi:MAG: hypothetical protein JKY37_29815 [Nannocystaceae bacterium]|nr:hypothetical protein [Nannocystaceae bacterium]